MDQKTDNGISGIWITVNRACQLRCSWCYASSTGFTPSSQMTFDEAKQYLQISRDLGILSPKILGGEPTLWKPLPELISCANDMDLYPVVVSNGVRFSDPKYLQKFDGLKLNVSVSLKAGNEEQQRRLTKANNFHKVLAAIQNLSQSNIGFSVSITITELNIGNLDEMVNIACKNGAPHVSLEFCTTTFNTNLVAEKGCMIDPKNAAKKFEEIYPRLYERVGEKLSIHVSLPFCLFSQEFSKLLKERNQIYSGCHVMQRSGVIFDDRGRIIPCNAMHGFTLGKLGEDFSDAEGLQTFWDTSERREFNDMLVRIPAETCLNCKQYHECGGGCPLLWFVYDPREVIPM